MIQFYKGMDVLNAHGNKVGKVERIVLDPRSKQVTHLVIQKGLLFKKDKVLPITLVETTGENEIRLNADFEAMNSYPDFEERNFVTLRERDLLRTEYQAHQADSLLFSNPSMGYGATGAWEAKAEPSQSEASVPVTGEHASLTSEVTHNIPDHTIALEPGARVICEGNDEIGKLERVVIDPQTGMVSHIVVALGPLNPARKLVPIDWVTTFGEGEIYLGTKAEVVRQLSEYRL